jgi:hypothetical protein
MVAGQDHDGTVQVNFLQQPSDEIVDVTGGGVVAADYLCRHVVRHHPKRKRQIEAADVVAGFDVEPRIPRHWWQERRPPPIRRQYHLIPRVQIWKKWCHYPSNYSSSLHLSTPRGTSTERAACEIPPPRSTVCRR